MDVDTLEEVALLVDASLEGRVLDFSTRADLARLDAQDTMSILSDLRRGRLLVTARLQCGDRELLLVRVAAARALTRREAEVAALAAKGNSNKAIAYKLGLALSTVSVYLMKASAKLGAQTRISLIRTWQAREDSSRSLGRPLGEAPCVFRLGRRGCYVIASTTSEHAVLDSLTQAERAVAARLLEGRSNAEIARLRRTSARTVANQVASIFRKLDVGSRSELASMLEGAPEAPEEHVTPPT
jgi:DNA-binding NarL/FixJ family response regulator